MCTNPQNASTMNFLLYANQLLCIHRRLACSLVPAMPTISPGGPAETCWDRLLPLQQLTGPTLDHPPSRIILKHRQRRCHLSMGTEHLPHIWQRDVQGKITLSCGLQHTPEAFSQQRFIWEQTPDIHILDLKGPHGWIPSTQMAVPQVSHLTEVKSDCQPGTDYKGWPLKEPTQLCKEHVRQCVPEKTKITVLESIKKKSSFLLLLIDINYTVQETQLVWHIW